MILSNFSSSPCNIWKNKSAYSILLLRSAALASSEEFVDGTVEQIGKGSENLSPWVGVAGLPLCDGAAIDF